MHLRYLILVIPLFLLSSGTGITQSGPHPHFRNYTTDDGLPSPEVHCAFEDSQGYMWFGTDNGVAKFDGYTFQNYGPEQGLLKNVILSIHEDQDNRLWFSSLGGEVYILENDSIYSWEYNECVLAYKDQYDYARLDVLDDHGDAYFKLAGSGVLCVKKDGMVDIYTIDSSGYVAFYHEKSEQTIFTHINRFGWPQITKAESTDSLRYHISIQKSDPWLENKVSITYMSDSEGTWPTAYCLPANRWIIASRGDIQLFQDGQCLWRKPFPYGLIKIKTLKDGRFVFLLRNQHGILFYNTLEAIKENESLHFLSDFEVSNLHIERNGGLWVTTTSNGVFYTSNKEIEVFDTGVGFISDLCASVEFKDEKTLFVGTDDGFIYEFDLSVNRVIDTILNPLKRHSDDLLYDSRTGYLYSKGAYYFNNSWHYFKRRHDDPSFYDYLLRSTTGNQHFDKNGYLIGATGRGIIIIDTMEQMLILESGHLKRQRTLTTFTDKANNLWLGTENGLVKFDLRDSSFTAPKTTSKYLQIRIEAIDQLPDSTLVLATKGYGIVLWKGDSIVAIGASKGLTSDMLEDVHIDKNGIIWAATLNGLNKIVLTDNVPKVSRFTIANGLPSNEIYQVKSFGEQIWLATGKGLVKFVEHPLNYDSPTPKLTAIMVNGRAINTEQNNQLAYDENSFIFHFTTLNFRLGNKIKYRHQLHPVTTWDSTFNRTVNYPELPSGRYVFSVQSQNEDGIWSKAVDYHFAISKPWWRTWWFRLSTMAFLGLLAAFVYRQSLKRAIAKQKLILEQKAKIAAERDRIATELHDDIGGSLSSILYLTGGVKYAESQGETVELDIGRVHELTDQAIKNMREMIWVLDDERADLSILGLQIAELGKSFAIAAGLNIQLHLPSHLPEYSLTSMEKRNALLICKEAFRNIIEHANATGFLLSISTIEELNQLIYKISISDNGKGIRQFNNTVSLNRGNGLKNMKNRAAAIGATLTLEDVNPTGTCLTIKLPLNARN